VQLAVAAVQEVAFFQVPLGQLLVAGVPKTYTHTNLPLAGVLERGLDFLVTGFSMFARALAKGGIQPSLVDLQSLAQTGHVNFELGQVSYGRYPATMIPAGGAEVNYFSNIVAAPTEFMVNRGINAISNRFHLTSPIRISEQENIKVTLDLTSAIAAVTDLTFVLWGTQTRPVR
jgi:hypothetical protein